jgi:sulfate transport system permease protein
VTMTDSASTLVLQGAVLPARKTLAFSARKLVPAVLILIAQAYFALILLLPLFAVLIEALDKGFAFYARSLLEAEALDAMKLTLLMAVLVVPLNAAFGVAAAWLLGKFRFPGHSILLTLIDLPLSVSSVVAGLVFVLMFGAKSALGPWLLAHDIKIIFALPGIWLSSLFVTLPYVAREVMPLLEAQGNDQEESAVMLGANGWQTFRYISLPQMKWALIHGVILSNARVMGEFGAVSVVSGHIRGETNTLPLLVEILYNEYQFTAAFAAASVLAVLALITLVIKRVAVKHSAIVSEH